MGFFDFFSDDSSNDMTRDYIGEHGEFETSDYERGLCEDMFSMRIEDHDADIESHFGWENELNYESDGYGDEESDF